MPLATPRAHVPCVRSAVRCVRRPAARGRISDVASGITPSVPPKLPDPTNQPKSTPVRISVTNQPKSTPVRISTADIAFVACGAFSGFHQVARRRLGRENLGFGRTPAAGADPDAIAVGFTPEQVENVANFQAYGFLPELIARFTRVVPFQALDAGTLKDILRADVVARMTREFKAEGFLLDIDEGVLDHIVADALRKETGARGLAASLTRQLEDVAFESFGTETAAATGGIPPTVRVRVVSGALDVKLD